MLHGRGKSRVDLLHGYFRHRLALLVGPVWDTLLEIPLRRAMTYSAIAAKLGASKAARAVGAAVGKNPLSFVVPCHRVLGKSGDITGYHWGLTRKRAMLGWETGRVTAG
jgi:AraC family transcriptional regulator of adaptative response/methylated-DNA-[protein]-cysteine methyltransferase